MKILLTQQFCCASPRTPIALMDLAAYARQYGHQVDVAHVERIPVGDDYDWVGFSALSFKGYRTLPVLKTLRAAYPGRIIFGGKATESLQPEDHEKLGQLGMEIHRGPGEALFNSGEPIDYENYPKWCEADFRALDRGQCMTEAMSSRGCPYCCHFCQNTEKTISYFSPERTIANMSLILNVMKRSRVFLVDDVFALRADRMLSILDAARKADLDLNSRVDFFAHVSLLGEKTIEAIQAFNPREIEVGFESGDDGILKAMGKTFTAAQAEERLRELHSRGIRVSGLFMMGFPGETRDSLQATVEFVDRNRKYLNSWWVSYYQPVVGTRGWEMARERVGDDMFVGGWSDEINYLDPNITVQDLREARWGVMTY